MYFHVSSELPSHFIQVSFTISNSSSSFFESLAFFLTSVCHCRSFSLQWLKNIFVADNFLKEVAFLFLLDIKGKFLIGEQTVSAILNSNVHLQCVSPLCLPHCEIKWLKDSKELSGYKNGSLPDQQRTSSTLQVTSFQLKDVGNYSCIAMNPMVNRVVKSNSIALKIKGQCQAHFLFLIA